MFIVCRENGSTPGWRPTDAEHVPFALQFGSIIAICVGPSALKPGAKEKVSFFVEVTELGTVTDPPGQTCCGVCSTFPLLSKTAAQGYWITPSRSAALGTTRDT